MLGEFNQRPTKHDFNNQLYQRSTCTFSVLQKRSDTASIVRMILFVLMRRYCTYNQRRLLYRRFFCLDSVETVCKRFYRGNKGTYTHNYNRALRNLKQGMWDRAFLLDNLDAFVALTEGLTTSQKMDLWRYARGGSPLSTIASSISRRVRKANLVFPSQHT